MMSDYFSAETQHKFMSASQFKAFQSCEASTLAELRGEFKRETTTAMLVGSFVDAHFEGTLDLFRAQNPEIFLKNGGLKADYKHAEYIIGRIERDKMFMRYMSGESQVVVEGKIAGIAFHGKVDSLHRNKAIVDLKIMKDFAPIWVDGVGKVPFVEAWGYDIQGAIYQRLVGGELPFFICAASKEKEPDIKIISIPQERLDYALGIVKDNVGRYADIKLGKVTAARCEKCDYCKRTKTLTEIVDYREV